MTSPQSSVVSTASVRLVAFLFLILAPPCATAQDEAANVQRLPEARLADLKEQLAGLEDIESTVERRRASKKIVRAAESLIDRHPDSPERFLALGIVFETQKIMFTMRQSEENRDALLATVEKLTNAPDEYADVRVEPDMMLVQLGFDSRDTSPDDRAMEIALFADRYRDTSAEAQSLMMAASAAFDEGHVILLNTFRKALSKRFSEDPIVTAFMRERFATGSQIHLSGEFVRVDGERRSFPIGQIYLVCFWSLDAPLLKNKIAEITAMQVRYKGQFRVFSFNLDELSDSGAAALKRMGLDWTPMRLPGGIENPTYMSVGGANMFSALVVGPHGLASRGAIGRGTASLHKTFESMARSPRRMSLLRSLCIGDYLVTDSELPEEMAVPKDVLVAVNECFPVPPDRYRVTIAEELTNYERAETLCGEAVVKHAKAEDLWLIHNRLTIALLGLWRLTGDLAYLDRAVATAKETLAMKLPVGANIIPLFAIATKALGADDAEPAGVLNSFIEEAGGQRAPSSAYAAALMLTLETHSRDEYIKYRDILLTRHADDPAVSRVTSILSDRSCASRLFERALPGSGAKMKAGPESERRLDSDWTALDGWQINVSSNAMSVINAVVFMEPTGDRNAMALRKRVVDHLVQIGARRPLKDLNVVGVFRTHDTNRVAAVMKQNGWSFSAVGLEESEWQRFTRELGVFSADTRPNVYLVRHDGTIVMGLSGVSSDTEHPDRLNMRIDVALRNHSLALAVAAKDYADYAARLATSFPLKNRRRSRHEPESLATSVHGRELIWAYMQAKDWKRALDAANKNIAVQIGNPNPRDTAKWCRSCHGHLHSAFMRVALLRKMGSKKKADEALALCHVRKCPHGKKVDALWADVEGYIKSRPEHRRFAYLRDPKRFLAEHEYYMRAGRQSLYGFGIASDLMMRATIHDKLGNDAAAIADRLDANVRAWPFKVRKYNPDELHKACVTRRQLARKHLEAEEWKKALALVDRNIQIHEGEALRCNSMCKICWAQVQSFGFRARTLDGLKRKKEADASRAMAELCKCPPGKQLESYKSFPINRMYGAGSGINRLNYILSVMKGENPYCNKQHRFYRLELAGDLVMRARCMAQLGEKAKAEADRKRAAALAYPLGANAAAAETEDAEPDRYVDLLSVE